MEEITAAQLHHLTRVLAHVAAGKRYVVTSAHTLDRNIDDYERDEGVKVEHASSGFDTVVYDEVRTRVQAVENGLAIDRRAGRSYECSPLPRLSCHLESEAAV